MCKWEDIQTRTELEFVLDVIKKKVGNININRIFSFDDAIPRKDNNKIEYNTLEEPLYFLFDNDYCLIIEFTNYSSIYLDYRKITPEKIKQTIGSVSNKDIDYLNNYHEIHGWDFDENRNRIEDSFRMKEIIEMHGNYDKISDIQIYGFDGSYEKWISNGSISSMITIPAGGDYFKSIKFILNNGIKISMCPQDAEMDGYYDLIIEDDNDIIKYRSEEMLLFSHILSNEKID